MNQYNRRLPKLGFSGVVWAASTALLGISLAITPSCNPESGAGARDTGGARCGARTGDADANGPDATVRNPCDPALAPGTITMLTEGSRYPRHLAVDEDYVYFLGEEAFCGGSGGCSVTGSLYRVPRCGGATEEIASSLDLSRSPDPPNRLAVGGGYVYVLTRSLARVNGVDKTMTVFGPTGGCASNVVADDSYVYAYDRCQSQILRGTHSETALVPFSTANDGRLLALAPNAIFFDRGNEIWRQDLVSSAAGSVYASAAGLLDFAADDRALVLEEGESDPMVRLVPLDSGAPTDLGPSGSISSSLLGPPETVWIEDGRAYYRHSGKYDVVDVSRVGTDGTDPKRVLRRASSDFVVRGDRLYWTEESGLYVARLPQPDVPAGPDADSPPMWTRRYGVADVNEFFTDVKLLPDGSAFVVGTAGIGDTNLGGGPIVPPPGQTDDFVARLSESGDLVWSTQITPDAATVTECLGVAPDQSITVVVKDYPFGDAWLAIHRYLPDGTPLADTRESLFDWRNPMCDVDARGNVYLLSATGLAAKKDLAGTDVWRKNLGTLRDQSQLVTVALVASPTTSTPHIHPGFVAAVELLGSIDLGSVVYDSTPGDSAATNQSDAGPVTVIVNILDDGSLAWSRLIRGGEVRRIAFDPCGRVLVLGKASRALDTGNGLVFVPRPNEAFTFLLWLDSDGSIGAVQFLDGLAYDAAIAADGAIFVFAGEPERPFYFDPPNAPGNYVYGVSLAKLDAAGQLVETHNLSPVLVPGAPSGYYAAFGRIALARDRVVVAGSVMPFHQIPLSTSLQAPDVVDAFAARFDP